eukprot:gnl/MRDRNA2_/MRDRNA2_257868_c0_seq1.p1 gnl/MRDRNA2_/MRDRNA2_257868_c0~~gnl/MRDRNA2_/MRDRNA2_257868_c0_seq1.p1  ORF type:complete len:113 (+),score=11.09 gnl/MRDRNA2_/MRDRNA2_257868_c0_seq1:108-446(+)
MTSQNPCQFFFRVRRHCFHYMKAAIKADTDSAASKLQLPSCYHTKSMQFLQDVPCPAISPGGGLPLFKGASNLACSCYPSPLSCSSSRAEAPDVETSHFALFVCLVLRNYQH